MPLSEVTGAYIGRKLDYQRKHGVVEEYKTWIQDQASALLFDLKSLNPLSP